MTIYSINKTIGWANSGVEYAQAYRAKLLRQLGQPIKFIFTDFFQQENIAHYTANLGFQDEEIVWLYGFFTDIKIAPTTYNLTHFEETLPKEFIRVERTETYSRYKSSDQHQMVTAYCRKGYPDVVQRVEYVSKNKLIRKDYFSYTKVMSEYYAPKDGKAHVFLRHFFNEDGSVAYVENSDGERKFYRIGSDIIFSKEELLGKLLGELNLTSSDLILLDRSTDIGQAVFRHKGKARLAVMIHAQHYHTKPSSSQNLLWNNFYEYQLTNADKVDAFVTATEEQRKTLGLQLTEQGKSVPIFTLPVGSLDSLRGEMAERTPYSLVSCSRLAPEKHLDWLIEAVALARKELPELTLAIYGAGKQEGMLKSLIKELELGDVIRLMGHQEMVELYQTYELYLSASTSEGFGLSLMEAIGSGLPIIGLDVPYGNQTFVASQRNGILLPRLEQDSREDYAKLFAQAIVSLYREGKLVAFREAAYQRASDFLTDKLLGQWGAFIKEVLR